jgi:ribose transport system substrate-binding protein
MNPRTTLRRRAVPLVLATVAATVLTACSQSGSSSSSSGSADNAATATADKELAQLKDKVLSAGPNGETASPASDVTLTDAQVTQVKGMNATAAIVMHYGGNDWATAQIAGLKSEFDRLGINVIATTDANFKPDQQVSDIQTVMTKKPSIMVSIPTDPVATAAAYRSVTEAGTKLVFMDNVPQGFKAGTDYVTVVSADNEGNGETAAHLLAKNLGGKGNIGVIYHNADFFVTKQRYDGFQKALKANYPNIKIVAKQGIAGPDFAGDAQTAANAMLSKNPNLDAIWAVWDVPAEGVMAAARAAGRTDLKIVTEDLGLNVAISMAKKQLVVGLGAQRPFDQGITEARAAALSLLGQKVSPYLAWNSLAVSHTNVLDAWKTVYHADPPSQLADSFTK